MSDDSKRLVEAERACDRCGRFDAIEIGEKVLCADCITLAGCACAENEASEDNYPSKIATTAA